MKATLNKIKSIFICLLCALCLSSNVVFADENKTTELTYTQKAKVSFVDEIESKTYEYEYELDSKMIEPEHSTSSDYTFDGWYLDDYKWNFEKDTVKDNMILYARYKKKKPIPHFVIPETGVIGLLTGDAASSNIFRIIIVGLLICVFVFVGKKNSNK